MRVPLFLIAVALILVLPIAAIVFTIGTAPSRSKK